MTDKIKNMASCMLSILDSLKLFDQGALLEDETLSEIMFRKMKAYNIDLNKELGFTHLKPYKKKNKLKIATNIKISEYLNNSKITCSTVLSRENWYRLLNSDSRILSLLDEWKNLNFDITVKIQSRKILLSRNLTLVESKTYGKNAKVNLRFSIVDMSKENNIKTKKL